MEMLETVESKHSFECCDCQRTLPASDYYWHKKGHRHSKSCKACYQIKRRPYQISYMARIGNEKARSRYSPEKRSDYVVKGYGITLADYNRLLESQNGGCAICGSKTAKTKKNGRFCIDHDHKTGLVRGLLCAPCNRGIGLLNDSSEVLRKAADYLESPPGSSVIDLKIANP